MHRTILLTSATLLFAVPALAAPVENGLQGGAAQAGCSSCSNDTQSGSEEHPNAEGQILSYPSCGTSCGGASGKASSEGSVQGGTGNGNGNGNDSSGYGNTGSL